jgi:FKBP-type peptidyl-prolyl cis-trans isomerase FklB
MLALTTFIVNAFIAKNGSRLLLTNSQSGWPEVPFRSLRLPNRYALMENALGGEYEWQVNMAKIGLENHAAGFAENSGRCENTGMRKTIIKTSILLAASVALAGYATAQQTPASSAPATDAQTSATQTPATQTPTTKKPKAKTSTTGGAASGTAASSKAQTGTGSGASGTATAKKPAAKTGAAGARTPFTLKTEKDKQSYAIGLNIGKTMHRDGVDIDPSVLARGIKDELAGGKVLMTDDEIKATLTALSAGLKKAQEEKIAAQGAANKSEGDAFLAANKAKDGVVTLPSGLQYKILKEGTGPKPTTSDSVVCNYKGTLLNGTEFDSSYKRGQPATFPVGQVIKGWTEALQLMPVGSKWELFVPAELAYGPRSPGGEIGPNSTLVFEVELLSIQPKVEKPAASPVGSTKPTGQGGTAASSTAPTTSAPGAKPAATTSATTSATSSAATNAPPPNKP